MSIGKLEVGDLLLTQTYSGKEIVEICQYRGETGSLMYTLYHPDLLLKSNLERFVKDTDSMPYCMSIVRKSNAEKYQYIIDMILKSSQEG
ncbi:hypothetical protein EPNKCIFM_00155 [Klebsiella phage KP13-16]|nr:hypothetical protein EPNKCIFM_00155 [Klebsiella phage KP13-16]